METGRFKFELKRGVPLDDAEVTLRLAMLAAEGLFGEAGVRLGVDYSVDRGRRRINIDAPGEIGGGVVRMFTMFLVREYGKDSFRLRRVPAARAVTAA